MPKTITDKLTITELAYFEALDKAYPSIVTRETLSKLGKQITTYERISNIVDVQIMNLRRKLKDTGYQVATVRGAGYRMEK